MRLPSKPETMNKKTILSLLLLLLIGSSGIAQKSEIFSVDNRAVGGYDVVAFFTSSKAIKGSESFSFKWKEAIWLFASEENLKLFKSNPDQFAPKYGGYCAYGMSNGYKAPTVIETWKIIDHQLYFNYSLKVQELWNKDPGTYIRKANANWENMKHQ